jgi:hypothetical protein
MPKISMWNIQKNKDYKFYDRIIREQYFVGGTGVFVHKYIGPYQNKKSDDNTIPNYLEKVSEVNETHIQDILFMENRDRRYENDIYELRGIYNVSDNDFDLGQFGLFLTNDTLFITFHLNDMIESMGRKLMSGDVLELPHLADDLGLEITDNPIPRFYVVQDANRASEGFSPTWYPHIWRVKVGPITDSQEFAGIIETKKEEIGDILSIYTKSLEMNNIIKDEATDKVPSYSHPELDHYYKKLGILGDNPSIPSGTSFPLNANQGDYFLRTDFQPNRLFVKRGSKWLYIVNEGESWKSITFNSGAFVENSEQQTIVGNREFAERQPVSAPIPKATKG